jgi:prepilin-type N-terminal cleavage/methylation domain-containing protein
MYHSTPAREPARVHALGTRSERMPHPAPPREQILLPYSVEKSIVHPYLTAELAHPAPPPVLSGRRIRAIATNPRHNARLTAVMIHLTKRLHSLSATGKRGFTLIEMLIVMSIISVTTLISVPYFLHGSKAREARNEVEKLAQTIRLARFRAITMNRDVYVHFEPYGGNNMYNAYANLGPPGSIPTGTKAEVKATRIEFGGKKAGKPVERFVKTKFAKGKAKLAPDGGSISGAIDIPTNPLVFSRRGFVEWPDSVTSSWGMIYVRHKKDPMLVWAIAVNRTGFVRVWTLRSKKKWS